MPTEPQLDHGAEQIWIRNSVRAPLDGVEVRANPARAAAHIAPGGIHMTGWRLGWAIGNEQIIQLMTKAAEFITSNPPAPTQQATIVALRDGDWYVRQIRQEYATRRDLVAQVLAEIPGVSLPVTDGAFYAFPFIEGLTDSTTLARQLVTEAGVAMTPGVAFGPSGEGHIRLCFAATEKTLRIALDRFKNFMSLRKG